MISGDSATFWQLGRSRLGIWKFQISQISDFAKFANFRISDFSIEFQIGEAKMPSCRSFGLAKWFGA